MIKKYNEFINESIVPKDEEFLQWAIEFKRNHDYLKDWDWLLSCIENDETSSDEELKEYFMKEKQDPETTEEIIDELIAHRTGFLIHMITCMASMYDTTDVTIFEPKYKDTRDNYPDMVE
jgi:Fe2+ transport system protein B